MNESTERPSRSARGGLLPSVTRRWWQYVSGQHWPQPSGGGHTDRVRYCYAVWMRHIAAAGATLPSLDGARVVELGPGRSIGVGLAALLSGAREYYAIDPVDYRDPATDSRILAELVELFRARAPIPDHHEFPDVFPRLTDYACPVAGPALDRHLDSRRLGAIEAAIRGESGGGVTLVRVSGWDDPRIPAGTIDLVLSQAVMLYVGDLDRAYRQMARWLSPGGLMSHTYNFTSVGQTPQWNGHWACTPAEWAAIVGTQPYHMSRHPFSANVRAIEQAGLRVERTLVEERAGGIGREALAPEFAAVTDRDLVVARALIQATRPRSS